MTTHGPIYQMVEEEMLTTKIEDEVSEGIVLGLKFILPKIQELEPTWISVEEQLPDFGVDVLVYSRGFHYEAYRTGRLGSWDCFINSTFHTEEAIVNDVTHWKPLPLPPTK